MAGILEDLKSVLSTDDLSEDELIRAIRVGIKAEIDAAHLYDMIAESTDNEKVRKVMKDVAKEERVHIGEFLRVIQEIYPDEMKDYNEGASEAEKLMKGNEHKDHEYQDQEQEYQEESRNSLEDWSDILDSDNN